MPTPPSPRRSSPRRLPRLEWDRRPQPFASSDDFLPAEVVYPNPSAQPNGEPPSRPNSLYLGDNLAAMARLLPEFEGKFGLVYADPPFLSGKSYPARIGRGEDSRKPKDWLLGRGYADDWPDPASYLDMLHPRLELFHRLLSPAGTLYLHLDWHAAHYARLLLDEIFGPDRLLNEIAWVYHGPSPIRRAFNRKHDTILAYTKSDEYTFNVDDVRMPYDASTRKTFASSPKAGFGKVPDLDRGKVPEDWWYFPVVARLHSERTGYPTQKPEALIERIVRASTKPGDWVADFFCGSGTLPVVAERLGRRWIAADLSPQAVHTTKKRLVASRAGPFEIWSAPPAPSPFAARLSANLARNGARACLTITGFDTEEGSRFPDRLDYWEVDPESDGQVFKSKFQVLRAGRRDGVLPLSLDLDLRDGAAVCVRAVSDHGERGELTIER